MRRRDWLTIVLTVVFGKASLAAEVTTDGSFGPAASMAGADLEVGEALGSRRGDNLFHSLSRLNIGNGESVRFTGANDISHVITRITDDLSTSINGRLASDIGRVGFWLISPAGITFGSNAVVDVPGAFHAAAGTSVNFADGTVLQALDGGNSVLSVAAPESFGLLGAPGSLTLAGATIVGQGPIELASANTLLLQDDSSVRIAQNGGGKISLSGDLVRLEDNAEVEVLNTGGNSSAESVIVTARTIELADRSQIKADTRSGGDAGDVSLTAETVRLSERSLLTSVTNGTGSAGRVMIVGGDLVMVGNGTPSQSARISSSSEGRGSASGVDIRLDNRLDVSAGARITSNATGTGDAGEINIVAASISVRSDSRISSSGNRLDNALGGAGGRITLEADNIEIRNSRVRTQSEKLSGDIILRLTDDEGQISIVGSQGQVTSETFSSGGAAGNIRVEGGLGDLMMFDRGRLSVIARGDATGGLIDIKIGDLEMVDRSFISATTEGRGPGGAVQIEADNITIVGSGDPQRSPLISSSSQGRGDAGGVQIVVAERVDLSEGGRITSNATDRGDGGEIKIAADTIALTGDSRISSSGNNLSNRLGGAGGEITISANQFLIDNSKIRTESEKASGAIRLQPLSGGSAIARISGGGGEISSATFTSGGSAGNVTVDVGTGSIDLSGGGSINAVNRGGATGGAVEVNADRLTMRGRSRITTTTEGRLDAGTVTVNVGELSIIGNDGDRQTSPLISSSSIDRGDAGLVTVSAVRSVSLSDGGRITSNSTESGRSGNVMITTSDFRMSGNSAVSSSGNPSQLGGSGDAGSISIAAITGEIEDSSVRTEASNAVGGRLTIAAQDQLVLDNATIVTDGLRSGDGSSLITLEAGQFLVINDSRVFSRVSDSGEGLSPQAVANTGIANLIGGQITISSDSDLQATFAVNVTGQENDVGSGLALPESVITDIGRLLNNRCAADRQDGTSSFRQTSSNRIGRAPDTFLGSSAIQQAKLVDC